MEKTMILDAKEMGITIYDLGEDDYVYGVDLNSEKAKMYQEQANQAWQQVYVTDFSNVEEVLDLLLFLHKNGGDNIYVSFPYSHLVNILLNNGYERRKSEDEALLNDKESYGRYLVGRAIRYMEGEWTGSKGLPNAVYYTTKEFKQKFVA